MVQGGLSSAGRAGRRRDNYWLYPTASNTLPTNQFPPGNGNSANYSVFVNDLTIGGAYTTSDSFYGTFDQGGNVWEWNESLTDGSHGGWRGGTWSVNGTSGSLRSSSRRQASPTFESFDVGFRVATIPEPSTAVLAAFGFIALAALGWRRKR